MHLVGFTMEIYYDARSNESRIKQHVVANSTGTQHHKVVLRYKKIRPAVPASLHTLQLNLLQATSVTRQITPKKKKSPTILKFTLMICVVCT